MAVEFAEAVAAYFAFVVAVVVAAAAGRLFAYFADAEYYLQSVAETAAAEHEAFEGSRSAVDCYSESIAAFELTVEGLAVGVEYAATVAAAAVVVVEFAVVEPG